MQTRPFEASVRQTEGRTIIDLRGEINRGSEETLNAAYAKTAALNAATVILNFSDVDYINSTGIAVIVGILARARSDGRSLTVYGLSDHYRTIFEITRLIDFMRVFPDEASAIRGEAQSVGQEIETIQADG